MGEPTGGLRAKYERSTLNLLTLQSLASDVARHPSRAPMRLVSDEALPKLKQTRTLMKEVTVRGFFRDRVEQRLVTETGDFPDYSKQLSGWWFCVLHWGDQEKTRDRPGSYVGDQGRVYYALLTDGKLVTIMETWREGVLIGGPTYQRWADSLKVDPLTEKDVVDLDQYVHHYSGTKGHGVAYTSDQFGTRLRDGVISKGDYLRAKLLELGAEAHRARLASDHPSELGRPPHGNAPRIAGVVKWVDIKKGFGFVTATVGGADFFFHVSAVETPSAGRLKDGASVTFAMGSGKKGPVAIAVRIAD